MTELQMGLIGLGAVAVIGVVAYNTWQEMRQRKQAEEALKGDRPDVLFDAAAAPTLPSGEPESVQEALLEPRPPEGDRVEPVLRLDSEPTEARLEPLEPLESRESRESLESRESPEPMAVPSAADALARAAVAIVEDSRLLSPLIDFIAAIDTVEPVPARRVLDAHQEIVARVQKPVRWIGYNELASEWEPLSARQDGEYRHLRAGLQLVDRQGPASENDLAIFSSALQELAEQLMGIVDLPARQKALEEAARLDQFCAGVDIQIGINVISQGPVFPGTKLRALAEAAGMTLDEGKRFVRLDDEGGVLYVLLNQDSSGFSAETMKTLSTHGVTFLLDVPRVPHGERVFNQMLDLARRFADVLQGALVDDNRRPLSETALEPIREQIGQYQAMLAARQLPAGSPLTQRLFS